MSQRIELLLYIIVATLILIFNFNQTSHNLSWSKNQAHELVNYVFGAPVTRENSTQTHNGEEEAENCVIPKTDPWDSRLPFSPLPYPTPLKCVNEQPELTTLDSNNTIRFIELESVESTNITTEHCQYRCFDRPSVGKDYEIEYQPWENLIKPETVECDFVDVRCFDAADLSNVIYRNSHAQVYPQPISEANERATLAKLPSAFIIVHESTSKPNFERYMPKTAKVLAEMQAVQFEKHLKVGHNSRPNVVPMLTGVAFDESTFNAEKRKLVWKKFAAKGYKTFHAEEISHMGAMTADTLQGFKHKPVDHFYNPFDLNHQLQGRPPNKTVMSTFRWEKCYGRRPIHRITLDYMRSFLTNYELDQPLFGFIHPCRLVHNDPRELSYMDGDYAQFLTDLSEKLNNSWLFMVGDHGVGHGDVNSTILWAVECVHVPLFVKPPSNGFSAFTKALSQNIKKVTSHFDIYHTLLHIASGRDNVSHTQHGVSLLSHIQNNRTCEEAGIPSEYCICGMENGTLSVWAPSNDKEFKVIRRAMEIVSQINQMFQAKNVSDKCARYELKKVLGASQSVLGLKISVQVKPNNANFSQMFAIGKWTSHSNIIRLDRYGSQSHCVTEISLKPYCFCV